MKKKLPTLSWKRPLDAFWLIIDIIPVAVPAALASFGAVAVTLLLFDAFSSILAWSLGILAALITTVFIARKFHSVERPGGVKEQRIFDIIAVVLIMLWVGLNIPFTSQHVFTDRDPATYAVAGTWLINNESIIIEPDEAFEGLPYSVPDSAGFLQDYESDNVYAQGQHLLPALLGLIGRITNGNVMLHANVIFGAFALLSIYGFARYIMRPRWAIVAPIVMGVSLPMLYFSRDTYTEPLSLIFTFGGLSALWLAVKSGSKGIWGVAGVLVGAGALVRIDAYLTIAAVLLFVAAFLLLQKGRRQLLPALTRVGIFAFFLALVSVVGFLDIRLLSTRYYINQFPLLSSELVLIAWIVIVAIVAIMLVAYFKKIMPWLDKYTRSWRGPLVFALVVIIALVLVSRPLWMEGEFKREYGITEEVQIREGDEVNAYRNYAEQSTSWVEWYIGAPAAIFGVGGIALAGALAIRHKKYFPLAAALLVIAGTSLVYLWRPSITPDQIWASRRLLPVILPGLVIFAVFLLDFVTQKLIANKSKLANAGAPILGIAVLVMAPLMVSWPFLQHREMLRLHPIAVMCNMLPDNAAVLLTADARLEMVMPVRAICDKPAANFSTDVEVNAPIAEREILVPLAAELRERGYEPVIVTYEKNIGFLPTRTAKESINIIEHEYDVIERTLDEPPHSIIQRENNLAFGIIEPDGTVVPIEQ